MLIPLYIRWIVKRWLMPCLSITFAMLILFSFFDVLNQLDSGKLGLSDVLEWVLRRTPLNLYEMLPFSVLLSSMVTATNWVKNSEWTLIRFAGWGWRHTIIGILTGGLFWGAAGLFMDTVNARYLDAFTVSRQATWLQSNGYILKIGKVQLTGANTATLSSIYVYPDSSAVEEGKEPEVDLIPQATLVDNKLSLTPPRHSHLPASIELPFYLILEPQTLERLDIWFLIKTLCSLKLTHTAFTPTEHILRFTFLKKIMYPLWMIYWISWGCLLFLIPPRFKQAKLYQGFLFAWGALLMFGYRTISTVAMQQGFSGWMMHTVLLVLGIGMIVGIRKFLKFKTGG